MYEFIDSDGERVTVRSARTLANLLNDGQIKRGTPFRRSGEPAYVSAGEHPELALVAETIGLGWAHEAAETEPPPALEPVPPPAAATPPPPPFRPAADIRGVGAPLAAWQVVTIPTARAPLTPSQVGAVSRPKSAPPPPWRSLRSRWTEAWAVIGWLLAALLAAAVAVDVAGSLTGSQLIGWLVGLCFEAVLSERAARNLARRFPSMPEGTVGAACAAVGAAGVMLVGARSIPLTVPLAILFFMSWRLLRRSAPSQHLPGPR